MHFPTIEIWFLIFQLFRSVFDVFGLSFSGPAFSVDLVEYVGWCIIGLVIKAENRGRSQVFRGRVRTLIQK